MYVNACFFQLYSDEYSFLVYDSFERTMKGNCGHVSVPKVGVISKKLSQVFYSAIELRSCDG